MARKRPRAEDEGDDEPTSQYVPRTRPHKQRRRDDPPPSTSVNRIKGKLRDVTRTLERSKNLPADIRIEKERALAGYKTDLENAEKEKRKQQMIKKYHMVRFFERQKATRKLKRLKKLLSNSDNGAEETCDLKVKVHKAQVDLNYTLFCPLGEKYTSLYKRTDDQDHVDVTMADSSIISVTSQSSAIDAPKPAMWYLVEQCMAENKLETLREGKLKTTLSNEPAQSPPATKAYDSRAHKEAKSKQGATKPSRDALLEAQAADSDEGFFEE